MYSIIDQQWKKKDNTCMLFALYSAMTEKLLTDLYVASETKGNCDHAMGIVSEGEGGECRLFDNTWTGNGNSKLYTMNSFASSLSNAQCCYFFNLTEL